MKNPVILLGVASLFLFVGGCNTTNLASTSTFYEIRKEDNVDVDIGSIITCSLSLSTSVSNAVENGSIDSNKIESNSSKSEEPLMLTFAGINTEAPILKGNMDEVPLVKIEGSDVTYFIETTPVGNIVLYSYFPESKTLILSKQYNLFSAFGTQMIGFCK